MKTIGHYINHEYFAGTSGNQQEVFNPATGQASAMVALAGESDINTAVQAAKDAWPVWSKTSPLRRARILDRFRNILWERMDDLAKVISSEHGKTNDELVDVYSEAGNCLFNYTVKPNSADAEKFAAKALPALQIIAAMVQAQ